MKKLLYFLSAVYCCLMQASFVDFTDSTSQNRFLGPDRSMCKITTNNSSQHYQKGYDCGNDSIASLLNVNFLSPAAVGQQFYLFNNFMYWIGQNMQSGNPAAANNSHPDTQFSGSGVFMVVIGTSSYLQQIIAPTISCSQGQFFVMAQLKYNDGNSIATWSQDVICLAPTDSFTIAISSDQDNTVPAGQPSDSISSQGVDWMKDPGPAPNVYQQASLSPRKIRLIKQ